MRWLKPLISIGLVVAAGAVALSTGLSNHEDDYGQVPIPPGGTLELPKGSVTIFFHELGDQTQLRQVDAPLAFQVVPVSGGPAVSLNSANAGQTGISTQ